MLKNEKIYLTLKQWEIVEKKKATSLQEHCFRALHENNKIVDANINKDEKQLIIDYFLKHVTQTNILKQLHTLIKIEGTIFKEISNFIRKSWLNDGPYDTLFYAHIFEHSVGKALIEHLLNSVTQDMFDNLDEMLYNVY